ncbi:hypothetical protein ACEWY4_022624 [Coilia grayii]|uniref:Putative nuclease HARBI1 n=1 Tax=Coilia grayii TaxID=363190 RepID=A0ABD1J9T1_9TELE
MAALALLEDIANRAIRRERVFCDRADFLAHDDTWLISRYRLPRTALLELCAQMGPHLERRTRHNQAIPVQVQVLSVLGFLATGTFQREIGDRSGISQSTFSRILPDVLRGIIRLCPRLIRFPYSAQEQQEVMEDFLRKTGFPNVIGAIDCTHVAIRAPHVNEYMYVNRKKFHSINVQLICDAHMAILNAVVRWPGSTHDSFIVRNCSVGNRLEAGAGRDGWLLGDRGYPLKKWLLTPIAHTETAEEAHFNTAHARAQSVVERSIGMLKGRWRCLDASRGRLLYDPEKVCQIILACCVLHNLCLSHGIELREEEMCMDLDDHPPLPAERNVHITALRRRREVIHQLYQQVNNFDENKHTHVHISTECFI